MHTVAVHLSECNLQQVDLGVPKTVRGVITQGARGGDAGSGATTDNRAFVRKYKVAHSLNAKDWNFIMDSKTSLPKVGDIGRQDGEVMSPNVCKPSR